jgi:hypothetical protein
MQKCLNEDATHFYKKFMKYPFIFVLLILFIVSGIFILTVSILCKVKFPCTDDQQNYSLYFGLNMCIFTTVFIILPCSLRLILNCIWYDHDELPVIVRTPLSSRIPSPVRSRSNSREPPSPKGRIPKHASKSFREYHSEV